MVKRDDTVKYDDIALKDLQAEAPVVDETVLVEEPKKEVVSDPVPGVVPTKDGIESLIKELGNSVQVLQERAVQDSNSLLVSRLVSFKSEIDGLATRYRTSIYSKL